jgi:hypothetical protein
MRIVKALKTLAVLGTLSLATTSVQAQEVVTVERQPNTAAIVLKSTIAGGVVGSAIAGGIILYETEINDNEDYDWQETLAWGAAIGLGAGLLFGIVDAASGPSYARMQALRTPVRDGQSLTLDVRKKDQSGKAVATVFSRRF